jgi:hypothetical protein
VKRIDVFVSYASDTEPESDSVKRIIGEETGNHLLVDGYEFNPISWKDILPGLGHPQEDKIDPIIADSSCKLVIIVLKNKLGTLRKDGQTGVEHEYELAKRLSKEIMIYRCDFLIRPSEIELLQLQKVREFVLKAKSEGLIEDMIPCLDEFEKSFRKAFSQWAKKLINNERDLSRNVSQRDFERHSKGF